MRFEPREVPLGFGQLEPHRCELPPFARAERNGGAFECRDAPPGQFVEPFAQSCEVGCPIAENGVHGPLIGGSEGRLEPRSMLDVAASGWLRAVHRLLS
jgi:hypothetical protein